MRNLIVAVALAASSQAMALEIDPALEVGAHAGVMVFDDLDVPRTSWYATPRITMWFAHSYGLELDVGFSTGATDFTDHGFFAMAPQLNFIGNPIPEVKNSPVQPILTIGAGLMYKSVDGNGVLGADFANTRLEAIASVGTGFIIPIVGPLRARTDIRMMATAARETDVYVSPFINLQWTAGLSAKFGVGKDTDKDKIPDRRDTCPTEAEDYDEFEDEDGCPDLDNDADGIPDTEDACPIEAEDVDTFEDGDGCPDPDNDADGILDGSDQCPLESGPENTGGCPDADSDGIADLTDRCPEDAGDLKFAGCPDTDEDGLADPDDECPTESGPLEAFGCPDLDNDHVPNYRDECPEKPAQAGIDPMRSNGCPTRVYVTADSINLEEKVYFSSGRATIQRRSYGLLDDIAAVLNQYPAIKKVRVEGHTDSQGNDDYNMRLSQDRAQAVVDYLASHGVEADRLVAKGFGETKPIADNGTSDGRAKNRRVAITILEQETVKIEKDITDVEEGEEFEVIEEGTSEEGGSEETMTEEAKSEE
jgi:outer membrane protein OmpA-like peptidoglycan-associated protein